MLMGDAVRAGRARLSEVSGSAALDAQLLMAEVLGISRAQVLAHPERPLTPDQYARFEALIARRAAGEPVAYLLGRQAFYDREFEVSPAVLIPRPETEELLERALNAPQAQRDGCVVVDVGTGSGALAVTFAALRPQARVYAIDISAEALYIARRNAQANRAQVHFLHGDLLAPLAALGEVRADIIMANLPYIDSEVVSTLDVSLYEPTLALDGGPDGLDLVRRFFVQAPPLVQAGALLLLEIGYDQGARAAALARAAFTGAQVTVYPDFAGHDRIVEVVLPAG